MKVLFIEERGGSDFTLDAVWAGLVSRLGWENVIDWPCKPKHRRPAPSPSGNPEEDYKAERSSICYTPNFHQFPELQLDTINRMLLAGNFQAIFLDERHESFQLYASTVARFLNIPVIVIAGHDRFWNDPKVLRVYYGSKLRAVFADNWEHQYEVLGFHPMNYATNFDHLWESNKRSEYLKNKVYDICFLGYNSHPDRRRVVEEVSHRWSHLNNCLFLETTPDIMNSFLPKREYYKKMAQSKICLNIRGAAQCGKALRFYEIPYVGSFMLSEGFGGKQISPFEDGIHCRYFSDLDDMNRLIGWALANPDQREKIAFEGYMNAQLNHTARARVDYIFEKAML